MRRLLGVSIVLLAILACSPNPSVESYSVVVNYDQGLEEMIAVGNYDYANLDITSENFPAVAGANGQVTVELELVCFNQRMSSEQVLAELDNLGFRPATLPEFLAFGAQYPNFQKQFRIVVLGSVCQHWGGYHSVPYLDRWYAERILSLRWFELDWNETCRFLAVRKSS